MDALRKTVFTYGGYDECWSEDGKLTIAYKRPREWELTFDGSSWTPVDDVNELLGSYLISAVSISHAYECCRDEGFPVSEIYEFLPLDRAGLIPSELFRFLMDGCGLGIAEAAESVVKYFGAALYAQPVRDWLFDIQPRCAHLESVLLDTLKSGCFAFHDAYDTQYRCPVGAVEDGTAMRFSVYTFGGVESAELIINGDGCDLEIPMRRTDYGFETEFTPDVPAALWYKFRLLGDFGERLLCVDGGGHLSEVRAENGEGFRLTVFKRGFETPEWFQRGIMYQIFPDRFGFSNDGTAEKGIEYHRALGQTPDFHGSIAEPVKWQARSFEKDYAPDDFYGGTLKGVIEKLPYLKSLGISIIYFNPVVEARSNHRYDTSDYSKVDPILGSVDDYVNLCEQAAALGIRIINDGVFSHTGADSIYFNRFGSYSTLGAYQSKDSEFYPWYDFRSFPDDYRCWWNFRDLPEVEEANPVWQEHIITGDDSIVKAWLRRGASGWRLDVADELPDEVLGLIRSSAKSEKPDSVIIGEVWEDAVIKESYGSRRNYALGYSLDSVMNYPFRSFVIDFACGRINAFELRDRLNSQKHNYPAPMYLALMNLLGSHDVERLHTALVPNLSTGSMSREQQAAITISDEAKAIADARQKLCAAIQYLVPGVPCLYYGDEESLDGARDPFNRAPFEPSRSGLHNFYAKLAEIRNGNAAVKFGRMKIITPSADIFIIIREYESERITCVINRGSRAYSLHNSYASLLSGGCIDCVPPLSAEIF